MNAIGYFRESAAGRRGDSIGKQNRRFLDFCDQQGYEVASTFAEDGKISPSGAYNAMIDFLKQPEKGFLIVVLPAPETLSDDPLEAAARFLQLERLGGKVQFMDAPEGVKADPLDIVLKNWSGAHSDDVSNKVKSALKRKAVRGEVLGRPPYGYRVGAHNRFEIVDDEALVVRYIFQLYLRDNLGIRLIARRLNEEGLRTRRDRPWSMVSIRDILRNRAYVGTYQRLGMTVPGTHAAIVSYDDFRRAQERLEDRRTNYSPRKVSGFLLSGLAVCASCGNRMIGVSRKQSWKRRTDGTQQSASYRYYQCQSRTNQGLCSYNTQRADVLDQNVRDQLTQLDRERLAIDGEDDAVIEQWRAEAARLRERMQQLDRRLTRSLEAAAGEARSRDRLRSEGLALAEERIRLQEELRDAEWRSEHYASPLERRRTRGAALDLLVGSWDTLGLEEKRQLLRELLEKVVVGEDGITLELRR